MKRSQFLASLFAPFIAPLVVAKEVTPRTFHSESYAETKAKLDELLVKPPMVVLEEWGPEHTKHIVESQQSQTK